MILVLKIHLSMPQQASLAYVEVKVKQAYLEVAARSLQNEDWVPTIE